MDYPLAGSGQVPAIRLCKYQWDYIHDPQKVWFKWLEKEDEGAIIVSCFKEDINMLIFKRLYNEIKLKSNTISELFNEYIENFPDLVFCVSEYSKFDKNREEVGYVQFLSTEKVNIVKLDDENDKIAFKGFNLATVTHELLHVTQITYEYSLDKSPLNWKFYNRSARDEVEVRLIMFYIAFKNANERERKNRDTFLKFLEKFWGKPDEIFTFFPLLGWFYTESGNDMNHTDIELNKKSKEDLYQIVALYMKNKINQKIDTKNSEDFIKLIKDYAIWLYEVGGYKKKERDDYYNFDGIIPLFNKIR